MYYLVHLAIPTVAAIVLLAIEAGQAAVSATELIGTFGRWYLLLAAPHLAWSVVTAYFEARKATTVGGFIGGHVLLFAVVVVFPIFLSVQAGAFLYLPLAPVAIALGAIVGRWYASQTGQSH